MKNPKRRAVIPILFGLVALGTVARNPRFEAIRNVDVLLLLACGACLGVGLTMLFAFRQSANQ